MLASMPRFSKSEAYITAASMQLALLWVRLIRGMRTRSLTPLWSPSVAELFTYESPMRCKAMKMARASRYVSCSCCAAVFQFSYPGRRRSAVYPLARDSTFSTMRSCGVTHEAMNEAYLKPLPQNMSSAERNLTGTVVSLELLEAVSVIVIWAVAAVISWFWYRRGRNAGANTMVFVTLGAISTVWISSSLQPGILTVTRRDIGSGDVFDRVTETTPKVRSAWRCKEA